MLNKTFTTLMFFCLMCSFTYAQVGINTTNPSPASSLHVASSIDGVSNFKGFLPPKVTRAERDAIPTTASDDGMLVYVNDGTLREVQIWSGPNLRWETAYAMEDSNSVPEARRVSYAQSCVAVDFPQAANYTYFDKEGDVESTSTYQWYTATDAAGSDRTAIAGATSSIYTPVNADLNNYISVAITTSATSGSSPGDAAFGDFLGPVATSNSCLLIEETFDTAGNGTRYSTSIPEFTDNGSDFFTRTNGSNITAAYDVGNPTGNFYFAAQDIDGDGANSEQSITFNSFEITGMSNFNFAISAAEDDDNFYQDWDSDSFFIAEYSVDGATFIPFFAIRSSGPNNTAPFQDTNLNGDGNGLQVVDTFREFFSTFSTSGTTMTVRLRFDLDDNQIDLAIDNVRLYGN